MTDATNYLEKFLVSLVGNQWCFLFPNVFRATSYIKTTNGIIKEIDTVLELEGILEIVLVFTLQKVTEVQKAALLHPASLSLGMAQLETKLMCADTTRKPVSIEYLFLDQQ